MKLLYLLPAMMLMILIFYFSSQEASASTETSTSLGRGIIFVKCAVLGEDLSESEIEKQALYIDHAVRKTAHATEYMVLGILLCLGIFKSEICGKVKKVSTPDAVKSIENTGVSRKINIYLISACVAILYACSDELHQYFVPGRSAQLGDVLIDSAGAIVGVLIYYFMSTKIKWLTGNK